MQRRWVSCRPRAPARWRWRRWWWCCWRRLPGACPGRARSSCPGCRCSNSSARAARSMRMCRWAPVCRSAARRPSSASANIKDAASWSCSSMCPPAPRCAWRTPPSRCARRPRLRSARPASRPSAWWMRRSSTTSARWPRCVRCSGRSIRRWSAARSRPAHRRRPATTGWLPTSTCRWRPRSSSNCPRCARRTAACTACVWASRRARW